MRRPNHPNILDVCENRLLKARVPEVMTRDVATVRATDSVAEAIRRLRAHNVKRLPVVEGRRVIGIVTRSDLLSVGPLSLGLPGDRRVGRRERARDLTVPPEGPGPLIVPR